MPTAATTTISSRPSAVDHLSHLQPAKKTNMSITQTYFLAHKARAKLSREAAQPDHDLRLLVGHANLLDTLMVELADAEREQEQWFNNSVRRADKARSSERHIQWVDRVVEEAIDSDDEEEVEYDSETSDSDSEYDEDEELVVKTTSSTPAAAPRASHPDEEISDDLEEDYAELELVRAPSHINSPPELVDHDFESSEDDEVMLPSPVDAEPPHPLDKDIAMAKQEHSLFEEEFYQPSPAGLAPAIPVY